MLIFVLTTTYELRVGRKSHLRDHPNLGLKKMYAAKNSEGRCDITLQPCGDMSNAATEAVTKLEVCYKFEKIFFFVSISSDTRRVVTSMMVAFDESPHGL
jgi:hypothetical protein